MAGSGMSRRAVMREQAALVARYRVILAVAEEFERLVPYIPVDTSGGVQRDLVAFGGCTLGEPRKGARVTERSGYSSGRSYGGVRVGPVLVGGSSGSTSSSTTVSYPAPDELTRIDHGNVVLTTRRISFIGSLFTRSTDYAKIAGWERRGRDLLIAPTTASKVHIIGFESEAEAYLASAIVAAGEVHPQHRLEDTGRGTDPEGGWMHLTIKTAREHIADQLTEVRQDLRDTVGMLARVLGQPAVPVALPAPPEAILARMEEDALVPLVREGEGSDANGLTSSRDRRTALALSLFLGLYGADRFYLGYHAMGWFKLFTAGGFLVLWIKDYRRLVEGTLPDSDGLPLARD